MPALLRSSTRTARTARGRGAAHPSIAPTRHAPPPSRPSLAPLPPRATSHTGPACTGRAAAHQISAHTGPPAPPLSRPARSAAPHQSPPTRLSFMTIGLGLAAFFGSTIFSRHLDSKNSTFVASKAVPSSTSSRHSALPLFPTKPSRDVWKSFASASLRDSGRSHRPNWLSSSACHTRSARYRGSASGARRKLSKQRSWQRQARAASEAKRV